MSPPDFRLSTAEVARLFRVDVKTVQRWARGGSPRLASERRPNGDLLFDAVEVARLRGTTDELGRLRELADWLVSLGESEERRYVTLAGIIERAREARKG